MELRINNDCIKLSLNPENCFYIRVMYNGYYLNLPNLDMYAGSSQQLNPTVHRDADEISRAERQISQSFDLTYHDFIIYLTKYL